MRRRPAAATTSAGGGPAVTGQAVDYDGSEGAMPAQLYVPDGPGRLPGILVFHTLAGPGPNVDAFARDLAGAGYVALAPDVFALHDFGPDGRTDHPLILKDAEGALAYLKRHPRVDPDRIALVGFSFGGRLAVLMGALRPDEARALVVYYAITSHSLLRGPMPPRNMGGPDMAPHTPQRSERPGEAVALLDTVILRQAPRAATAVPLTQRVGALRAPVMIHHGEVDANVPVAQARLLHQALVGAGKSSVLHVYQGADHLFNFSLGPDARFHPEAARLSWQRTLDFLARNLK